MADTEGHGPARKIDRMWAWIETDQAGNESLVFQKAKTEWGSDLFLLVATNHDIILKLAPIADVIMRQERDRGRVVTMNLCEFRRFGAEL